MGVITGEAVHVYSSGLRQRVHTEDIPGQSSPLTQVSNDTINVLKCTSRYHTVTVGTGTFLGKIYKMSNKVFVKKCFY